MPPYILYRQVISGHALVVGERVRPVPGVAVVGGGGDGGGRGGAVSGRRLHSSTFRLNVSTFCWIRWVHDFPPVY